MSGIKALLNLYAIEDMPHKRWDMSRWDDFFDRAMREMAKERVVRDVGGARPFHKGMAKYRELFAGCDYKTVDIDPEAKPDIVGDIHNLSGITDGSVDGVICRSVLEHVEDPMKAVSELRRILRDGGKLYAFVPFVWPYHGSGYKDYWRFTRDGVELLFRDFSKVEIEPVRGTFGSMAINLPAALFVALDPIASMLDNGRSRKATCTGFNVFAIK